MLMEDAGMSPLQYGLAQIPVFGALIGGNLLLVRLTDQQPLGRSVSYGVVALVAGALVMLAGSFFSVQTAALALMLGCSLMCLGHGLCYAVLYRFALTITDISKGAVAASVGMLTIVIYAVGVEVFKFGYFGFGALGFSVLSLVSALLFWWLASKVVAGALRERGLVAAGQQA
jgi:DHA1 family multidrug/chloramphenicol efflux transport protein-like MFS transporter